MSNRKDSKPPRRSNNSSKIRELEERLSSLAEEHRQKMLEFIDKKSSEASEIIAQREGEIRRRLEAEFAEREEYLHEREFTTLVGIVSQFSNVMNSIKDEAVANYLVGFRMFLAQFNDLLSDLGIVEISPGVGDEFDSSTMEIVEVTSVPEAPQGNRITKVFSSGYRLKNRIIKLSRVGVGKYEAS